MPPADDSLDRRVGAIGLVVAPIVFIVGWAVTGPNTLDYSAVYEAISELAAEGADQRMAMTGAFVGYGIWLLVAVPAVRRSVLRPIAPALVVNALATFAVAALPLHRSTAMDRGHGVAAFVGYASLAAIPLLGGLALRRADRPGLAAASFAASGLVALFLVFSALVDADGLFQRLGLTVGDLWLVAAGVAILAGRLDGVGPAPEAADPAPVSEPGACT